MRHSPIALVLAVGLLGCGGASPQRVVEQARSEGPPPGMSNDNVPPRPVAATAGGSGGGVRSVAGQILVTGPGFTPAILQATGAAGGMSDQGGCPGHFPDSPQHVVKVNARVPTLRIMIDQADHRDLTLAVHLPDGQWLCDDDSGDPGNGLNPVVDVPQAGPGEFEVYVGTFGTSDDQPGYTIGVTENPSTFPSSMRPGGTPMPSGPPMGIALPVR